MMEFIGFMVMLTIFLMTIGMIIWATICLWDAFDEDFRRDSMARWNFFKWIISGTSTLRDSIVTVATWKPKSDIDKEIAEEEKEIAELERQKAKIDELAELKRRKEILFDEVHSETNADCRWCGADDCLQSAYTVDGIAQYYCTSCHRWLYDGSGMA